MANSTMSPGQNFRRALADNKPLQIVGTINAYTAMMAERIGHKAIYVSGGGVANASYGLPDLGITSLNDVAADVDRITAACALPLLVDIDTGWGGAFNIAKTVRTMTRAGAAALQIEDQVAQKRCGHRPNKSVVNTGEMVDRIKAAVDARDDDSVFILARSDAFAGEGLQSTIDRCLAYVEAGADGIFAEALTEGSQYSAFTNSLNVPVLANLTEFGKTPLYNKAELAQWGVAMILYPLSAFRAMNKAAEAVYRALLNDGDQNNVLDTMQTRQELYDYLNYHAFEKKLDELFDNG